ncbi:MAG: hypothetical protein ACOCY1_04915 [Halovenus sp.]
MSETVEELPVNETDTDLARVRVTMEDAVGTERVYEISLPASECIDGAYVMSGRRVDDDAPEDQLAGGGPSSGAYDAAREHFRKQGFDVFGGGEN